MSIQAYDADMVERPGIEALAAAGVSNLWRSLGRVWPLWSALTLVFALGAAVLASQPAPSGELQLGTLATAALSSLGAGLVTGIAMRAFLDRDKPWRPDLGLAAYAAIITVLGTGPAALAALAPALTPNAAHAAALNGLGAVSGGLVAGLVLLWASLRLTLWAIGRLVCDEDMSPGRSWKLMRGAVLSFALAVMLLGAPVFILDLVVTLLTQSQGQFISRLAATPLASLLALLAAAVAAEVYRMRVRLQDDPVED